MGSVAQFTKRMARRGQASWQAVRGGSALWRNLAAWMRCTQQVHFSMTPRERTVTCGLGGKAVTAREARA